MRHFVLVLLLAAAPLAADPSIQIGDIAEPLGMLPDNRIFLRNASGSDLDFWLSLGGEHWQPYMIRAGKSALIAASSLQLAIATAPTQGDPAADLPPALAPDRIPAPRHHEGVYFYTQLKGGDRGQFCWSQSLDFWQVQNFGDNYCN